MAKGVEGIPALKLESLNKLVAHVDAAPTMFFSNMFPAVQYPSDEIRWEIEYGSAGMTPFVAPGSIAPVIGHDGIGEASAKSAYWKEKMFFDEEFLNNMRQPGTVNTYETAERKLAKGIQKLDYRVQRRREWMMANMVLNGSLAYAQKGGTKFHVSYGVPDSHRIALGAAEKWDGGANANPIQDIFDMKTLLKKDSGMIPEYAIMTSELLQVLVMDSNLQALLQKSSFGNGDLFARPAEVLGTLFGVGTLYLYDEMFEVHMRLVANVTGGVDTVVEVDDATDVEVGGDLRFYDMSKHNKWEDCRITDYDVEAGTVTLATAPAFSYKAITDAVVMQKKFITENDFFLFNSSKGNEKIAEFMEAPYGVDRRWGKYADRKEEWDPEGLWLRVQDKGLPVLYHPTTTIRLSV